jgi:hypothetical protein
MEVLFSIKDLSYSPEVPRKNDPFTVRGKVELFGLPFVAPVWVIVTVTYPETWWEEILPIIGASEVRESSIVVGGDFELTFKTGFIREGEFKLAARVYIGPTIPLDSLVLPPAPAFATEETTFIVAGTAPPQEENFRNFRVVSYGKGAGTPVTPPGVLDLNVGDACRVNVAFDHTGPAVTGKLYSAIGNYGALGFDEVLKVEKAMTVPASTDWVSYSTGYYVDIPITSAISKGTYSLYAKIIGITGGDVLSPYLEDVITIAGGGPVAEWVMVQEVVGITVAPEAVVPPAVWTLVQEIAGITVAPEAVVPPAGWNLVQEVSGITIAPEAPPTVYTCPYCGATFSSQAELNAHIQSQHPTPPTGWNLVAEVAGITVMAEEAPVKVSFQAFIINWDSVFPGAQKWQCFYFDPGRNGFVGGSVLRVGEEVASFSGVLPGGYLAVFLFRDSEQSPQFTSGAFQPTNGGIYCYDLVTGLVFYAIPPP